MTLTINNCNSDFNQCSRCGGALRAIGSGSQSYCINCGYVIYPEDAHLLQPLYNPKPIQDSQNGRIGSNGLEWTQRSKPEEIIRGSWTEHSKASDNSERRISQALATITMLSINLSVQKEVALEAAKIFRRAYVKSLIRGHSIDQIATSALCIALRQNSIGIPIEELAAKSSMPKKVISECIRKLQRGLGLRLRTPDAQDYATRILGALGISNSSISHSVTKLLKDANDGGFDQGRNPVTLAAAAIYLAARNSDYPLTQRKIASISGITEYTIRTACPIFNTQFA